jgi:hypothetical protein
VLLCFATPSLQIAERWLPQGCHGKVSADLFLHLALMMFLLLKFQKMLQNCSFLALAPRSGFGATLSVTFCTREIPRVNASFE